MIPHQWRFQEVAEFEDIAIVVCVRCGYRTDVPKSCMDVAVGPVRLNAVFTRRAKVGFILDCDVSLVMEIMES